MRKIGFLVNPVAGLGGRAGMKGSDGEKSREHALSLGYQKTASERASAALGQIRGEEDCHILAPEGEMGGTVLAKAGIPYESLGKSGPVTDRTDTIAYAREMRAKGVDLLVFCGGDGTARDIYEAVGSQFPVLGVPAGVKMYSACFGVNPWRAGELLRDFIRGRKLSFEPREVMDIDETCLSDAGAGPALYGFLTVPDDGVRLQRAKEMSLGNGEETEDLARYLISEMKPDTLYIVGPGGTTYQIKKTLCGQGTLRGVDLIKDGKLLREDADEKTIYLYLEQEEKAEIIVTCIGGNGFLFGRGNQQISSRIIRKVTKEHIRIAVTRQKLAQLETRPMLVDTGDRKTDQYLAGYYRIQFNKRETAMYRVERS